MDVLSALEEVMEGKAGKTRKVRTPEGVRRFHQPIGTPIIDHPSVARAKKIAHSTTTFFPGYPTTRPTATHPKLTEPLSGKFHEKYNATRGKLDPDSAQWFDAAGIKAFDRPWRSMDGGPGHEALNREAQIRAVGKVIDAEVERRVRAAGIQRPLDKKMRNRVRAEHSAIYDTYDDGKWKHMEPTAVRMFGAGETYDIGNGMKGQYERWMTLDDAQRAQLIDTIHAEHPDLAALKVKMDALMGKLVADPKEYKAGYAAALDSVLTQLRPMGGEINAKVDPFTFTIPPKDALGFGAGVIPFEWRDTKPVNVRAVRPVVMDRMAERDFNRLDQGDRKRTIVAIDKLQHGTIPIQPKERGVLAGTYGVVVDSDTRVLLYPHVDGAWHVYAIIPHHDYREAERRMSGRPSGGVSGGGSGRGTGGRSGGSFRFNATQNRVGVRGGEGSGGEVDISTPTANPVTPELRTAMQTAAESTVAYAQTRYPSSWVDTSNAAKPMIIGQSATGRGFYSHRWDNNEDSQLMLGNNLSERRVMVHEFAHRMEAVMPQLQAAEWAFHWRRTSVANEMVSVDFGGMVRARSEVEGFDRNRTVIAGQLERAMRDGDLQETRRLRVLMDDVSARVDEARTRVDQMQREILMLGRREERHPMREIQPNGTYLADEFTHPDKYIKAYSGKDYGDGPNDSYEILSMGMEGIWEGSWPIWEDPEYKQLVVGLLAAA